MTDRHFPDSFSRSVRLYRADAAHAIGWKLGSFGSGRSPSPTHPPSCAARAIPSATWRAILTAAGDKAFSSGMDLKEAIPALAAGDEMGYEDHTKRQFSDVFKPIIAAVNGSRSACRWRSSSTP